MTGSRTGTPGQARSPEEATQPNLRSFLGMPWRFGETALRPGRSEVFPVYPFRLAVASRKGDLPQRGLVPEGLGRTALRLGRSEAFPVYLSGKPWSGEDGFA